MVGATGRTSRHPAAVRGRGSQQNSNLGMRGFTRTQKPSPSTAPKQVFVDGDDTPWSKAFLASAYASRGLKMRFTSGTGSEVQMGYAEGKSMLYLEIRCIRSPRAPASQGIQNGSITCIGVPAAVPGGIRTILAENVVARCDRPGSARRQRPDVHPLRRAHTCPMLDAVPARHRLHLLRLRGRHRTTTTCSPAPTHDVDDYDDYLVLQRDLRSTVACVPVTGSRRRLPSATRQLVHSRPCSRSSDCLRDHRRGGRRQPPTPTARKDMPARNVAEDLAPSRT